MDMIRELYLPQIEADVVIVMSNPDRGIHRVCPLWECDMSPGDIYALAMRESLTFAEQCGGGYVDTQVIDHRTQGDPG